MVKRPYIAVNGTAERSTDKAVLLLNAEFVLNGVVHQHPELWIPLANLTDDCQDTVEEAVQGDSIEVFAAKWWLGEQ